MPIAITKGITKTPNKKPIIKTFFILLLYTPLEAKSYWRYAIQMSGHNKWSQIKHKKGAEDAKRSRRFSILARAITMEAKRANGDRNTSGLKTAIEKARAENLPNENIERAIKNAIGAEALALTEVLYECYGPGGVAIMIEGITDNKNRTSQEIKHLLGEHGAALAAPGAVAWAFRHNEAGWQARSLIPISEEERSNLVALIKILEENADIRSVTTNADNNHVQHSVLDKTHDHSRH